MRNLKISFKNALTLAHDMIGISIRFFIINDNTTSVLVTVNALVVLQLS